MDYLSLKAAVLEAEKRFVDGKVRKASQISPFEIALDLKSGPLLFLSIDPSRPGLFLLDRDDMLPGLNTPFSGLLEARIGGTILKSLRLPEQGERIVFLDFAAGWPSKPGAPTSIVLEVMGQHSNLCLLQSDTILQPLKTVPENKSRIRPVLPGQPWKPPPTRPGTPLEDITPEDLPEPSADEAGDVLPKTVLGLSPYSAGQAIMKSSEGSRDKLFEVLTVMSRAANGENGYLHRVGGRVRIAPFEPVTDHSDETVEHFTPFSAASAVWKEEGRHVPVKEQGEREQLAGSLREMEERLLATMEKLDTELERCRSHENIRLMAETLLVHAMEIDQGLSSATLPNPYEPGEKLTIPLDPALSAAANADRMFTDAHRLKRGIRETSERRKKVEKQLASVNRALAGLLENGDTSSAKALLKTRSRDRSDNERGTFRAYAGPGKRYFIEGFTILVGRSALDNERVTFQAANPHDLWLHARDYPGSHVVILAEKKKIPESVLYRAAELAAEGSGAKNEKSPEIMVTERKWVRKLKRGKPGKVTVERFRTIRPRSG